MKGNYDDLVVQYIRTKANMCICIGTNTITIARHTRHKIQPFTCDPSAHTREETSTSRIYTSTRGRVDASYKSAIADYAREREPPQFCADRCEHPCTQKRKKKSMKKEKKKKSHEKGHKLGIARDDAASSHKFFCLTFQGCVHITLMCVYNIRYNGLAMYSLFRRERERKRANITICARDLCVLQCVMCKDVLRRLCNVCV